jgi:recombinational DNA repair protein RecR
MKDNEALIKTYVDEVQVIKNKLAGYVRKDQGNL